MPFPAVRRRRRVDEGRDDAVGEGLDQGAEGQRDDQADRDHDQVALHQEFLEASRHPCPLSCRHPVAPAGWYRTIQSSRWPPSINADMAGHFATAVQMRPGGPSRRGRCDTCGFAELFAAVYLGRVRVMPPRTNFFGPDPRGAVSARRRAVFLAARLRSRQGDRAEVGDPVPDPGPARRQGRCRGALGNGAARPDGPGGTCTG